MSESEIRGKSGKFDEPDEFERRLIEALSHVDAPPGFAARVLESAMSPTSQPIDRTQEDAATDARTLPARRRFAGLQVRAWAGGALAAMLTLGLLAAGLVAREVHVRHQREQVALAQQQFETAMRLTGQALDQTRAELRSAGFNLNLDLGN